MKQIILNRALWSPNYSQCITGYDVTGDFIHTERVYTTCKEDVYSTADGQTEYVIQSWAPDGRGYSDRKKS